MHDMVRLGVMRQIDEQGRVVLSREVLHLAQLEPRTPLMQTLVVDRQSGKVRGILLEPAHWLAAPEQAPELKRMLTTLMYGEKEVET